MPTPPKALEHMSKNLTEEERQLRQQAEEGVIPDRGRESRMEKPAIMTKNAAAGSNHLFISFPFRRLKTTAFQFIISFLKFIYYTAA